MYHLAHGVYASRPAPQISRVGGIRSSAYGRFARRVPSYADYGQRTCDLGSQRYDGPRSSHRGDRHPRMRCDMFDVANPIVDQNVEQMARHWFSTHFPNPSAL
jgi:hypothetical protein